MFEWIAVATGDEYLRDKTHLRAGEVWSERLRQMIDQANLFQLFWSRNAMKSDFVRAEYEYALALGRAGFIRPTYWEDPLPEDRTRGLPPESLKSLHFVRLDLEQRDRLVYVGRRQSRPIQARAPKRRSWTWAAGLLLLIAGFGWNLWRDRDVQPLGPDLEKAIAGLAVLGPSEFSGVMPAGEVDAGVVRFWWRGSPAGRVLAIRAVARPPGSDSRDVRISGLDRDYRPMVAYDAPYLDEIGVGEGRVIVVWDLGLGERNPEEILPVTKHGAWPLEHAPEARSVDVTVVRAGRDLLGWAFEWVVLPAHAERRTIQRIQGRTFTLAAPGSPRGERRLVAEWNALQDPATRAPGRPGWLERLCLLQIALGDRAGALATFEELQRLREMKR
jgi:hypothetical protein